MEEESTTSDTSTDYYTYLNIPRNATKEEIHAAYKRASLNYHPDKHLDPAAKKSAEFIFNKVNKAYEVLKDDTKRAIYDTVGEKGLHQEELQVIARDKTPEEIRQAFIRLKLLQEQQLLEQKTHPKGEISLTINATELFQESRDDDAPFPVPEVQSMAISQSIEAPLSLKDTVTLSGGLNTKNGTGSGQVAATLRRIVNDKSWIEGELSIGQGPHLSLRGYRSITKKQFISSNVTIAAKSGALVMSNLQLSTGRFLSKSITGYLTWRLGTQSIMNTTLTWDLKPHQLGGSIQIGRPHSIVLCSYSHQFEDANRTKVKGSVKVGTFGGILEYGCETKISKYSNLGATMVVGVPNGVMLKIKLTRSNQVFSFPILLADEIYPSAVFYGTVTPAFGYWLLLNLVINPYRERNKAAASEKDREESAARVKQARQEARSEIELLRTTTYRRLLNAERALSGLIIVRGLYGEAGLVKRYLADENLKGSRQSQISHSDEGFEDNDLEDLPIDAAICDVRIPLQCLVSNSKLRLPAASKKNLQGFYDPCTGSAEDEKCLLVKYSFRNMLHLVIINDEDPLEIPHSSHLNSPSSPS